MSKYEQLSNLELESLEQLAADIKDIHERIVLLLKPTELYREYLEATKPNEEETQEAY